MTDPDLTDLLESVRDRILELSVAAERQVLNGQTSDYVVLKELSGALHQLAQQIRHVRRADWSQAEQRYAAKEAQFPP
jgi:hypothetical protein